MTSHTSCRRDACLHAAARSLALLVAPIVIAGCTLSERPADEAEATVSEASAPASEPGESAAPSPSGEDASATTAAQAAGTEAPLVDVGTRVAAAPDLLKPRREGVAWAITSLSAPPASGDEKDGAHDTPGGAHAAQQVEFRRWSLGHVELRGQWKPVVVTGEEAAPAGIYEFRTGTHGWVQATAAGLAEVRMGEMTRARLSQWRFGDDETGRLVIELTRGRVQVRPTAEGALSKPRDVLVKTPAGDVVVREAVEVLYDAAAGVRSRLPAN